jgi:hypothetical protein
VTRFSAGSAAGGRVIVVDPIFRATRGEGRTGTTPNQSLSMRLKSL